MVETNYGIANTGSGQMSFTDSAVTFGGDGSDDVAPAARGPRGPVGHGGSGPRSSPPITNTGTGSITVDGESLAYTGPAGATRSGGSGSSGGGASRWPDAGGTVRGGSSGGGGGEFGDLATVRRFAEQICALGEGSDFVQTIKACAALQDMVRDFGGDMNREAVAFMEAAIAVAAFGEALREQATQVASVARDLSGE